MRGGEGEVCGVGAVAAAEEIAAEADGDHAEGDGGERAAEEAHGGAGEVVEVAEGEVVEVGVPAMARRVTMSVPGAGGGR